MKVKNLTLIALFAALMAICSWISIPTAVPFTLQTFAVFLAVGLLGGKRGTVSVLVYIFIGAIGLPVFSGFKGGIGVLLGNTGGYIVGFIGSVLVVWAVTHLFGRGTIVLAVSMLLGLLVCYSFGTAWFMVVYTQVKGAVSLGAVLSWCVVPFVVPDLLKIALVVTLSSRLKQFIKL